MSPTQKTTIKLSKVCDVPLADITTDESVFQFRNFYADGYKATMEIKKSGDHITTLVDALKNTGNLDPITLWKNEDGLYVIVDGHHRFKAYKRRWKGVEDKSVPVRFLPDETTRIIARRYALGSNRKDKLPMSKAQKTQAAWNIICTDYEIRNMSSRKIGTELGLISHETANNMKQALDRLKEKGEFKKDDIPLWSEVNRYQWDDSEFDSDEWTRKRIEKLSVDLGAVLRTYGGEDPGIIQEAMRIAVKDTYGYNSRVEVWSDDEEAPEDLSDSDY